jgi:hypothetical protein
MVARCALLVAELAVVRRQAILCEQRCSGDVTGAPSFRFIITGGEHD